MIRHDARLNSRNLYLNKLIAFQDTEVVKVITGIRRCGKSSLLKLMQKHLLSSGIGPDQILSMNFESMEYRDLDSMSFYKLVKEHAVPGKRLYMFFDELQRLEGWEDAVNSFRVDLDCDIYITGSNAYLLSSEYSTYLSGRYVEIMMYPLSFREFVEFHGYEIRKHHGLDGKERSQAYDENGTFIEWDELFDAYLHYGGMPGLADVGLSQESAMTLLESIYSTVVVRDVLQREKRRGVRQITDPELLRRIILFLADNIGNNTSLNSISNTLVSEKLLEGRTRQGKPATQTVAAYVGALLESYMFYEAKRYDVKGKEELKTLGKYYIADIGLRNYLLGYRDVDIGHMLENIVYFELLRRGYSVTVGKVGEKEIDFIATKDDENIYYQVTAEMYAEETRERELAPLRAVKDNYEKVILVLNTASTTSIDGIRIERLTDFLLGS